MSAADRARQFESDDTTVDTSLTVVHTSGENPHDHRDTLLSLEVENTGDTATSGFDIQIQDHTDGEWYSFLEGNDFDSTSIDAMRFASDTGPHELGAGNKAHVQLRIGPVYRWRARAQVASGTTTVQIRGTERSG